MDNNSLVYAIVLNYKVARDTLECVTSIASSDYKKIKILVIDNDSRDDSNVEINEGIQALDASGLVSSVDYEGFKSEGFIRNLPEIYFCETEFNMGFAGGVNFGLEKIPLLEGGYILIINPDVVVDSRAVSELLNSAKSGVRKSVFGCVTKYFYGDNLIESVGGAAISRLTGTVNLAKSIEDRIDYICGGAVFFGTHCLKEVGGLPEDYFLYWEDADWSLKALGLGYELSVCEDAVVYNKGGTSIGRGYLANYYYAINGLRFFKKHKYFYWHVVLLNLTVRTAKKIMICRLDHAKAIFFGTLDFVFDSMSHDPVEKKKRKGAEV